MSKVELNLACGKDYRKGWTNIDNKQMYGGDMKVDMDADLFYLQWAPNTVDTILCIHFIQYVTPQWLPVLLKRWHGWLKEGGIIYIEAGDIRKVAKHILDAKTTEELHNENAIMQLYGIDDRIWNKWAWAPDTVEEVMRMVGFTEIVHEEGQFHYHPQRDFLIVGKKTI